MKEFFTISFPMVSSTRRDLALAWEKLAVARDRRRHERAFLAKAKDAVAKAKPDDWRTPLTAARYLYDNKYALDDAAKFLEKSLATKETFGNLSLKANVSSPTRATRRTRSRRARRPSRSAKTAEQKPDPEAVADLEKKIAEWKK